MNKKGTKITQEDFDIIKELSKLNLPPVKIQEITNRSPATIKRITDSKTLEDYTETLRVTNLKYRKWQEVVADLIPTEVEDRQVALHIDMLDRVDPLERIAIALERLVKCWENK